MAACVSSRIPDEVVISEILVRLPASCVVRLRSVCRWWFRLTTDPSFARAHTARTRRRRAAGDGSSVDSALEPIVCQLNDNGRTKPGELRLAKLDAHDHTNVLSIFNIRSIRGPSGSFLVLQASCDGLLCFQPGGRQEPMMPYYVCNPVMRIWTTVAASARFDAASLNRDCWYRRYLCGFYFHRPTQKYRLLHYSFNYVNRRYEGAYEVATVGGGDQDDKSWRTIYGLRSTAGGLEYHHPAKDNNDGAKELAHFAHFGLRKPGNVRVNGSLHWLHYGDAVTVKMGIVAFDTESEKFSRMSTPLDFGPTFNFRISKVCGNLCVGRITEESESRYAGEGVTMELWMLKDYARQQWVKLHTIQPDRHGFVRTVRQREGGGVRHGAQEEGELLVRWGVDSFGLYNFKLKTHKPIKITSFDLQQQLQDTASESYEEELTFYHCHLVHYTESLVDPRT